MKITMDIEMSPQEAKELFNVPDMKSVFEEKFKQELDKYTPQFPQTPADWFKWPTSPWFDHTMSKVEDK